MTQHNVILYICVCMYICMFFETRCHFVPQAVLKLVILHPQPPVC
jgi:hypothetical protein